MKKLFVIVFLLVAMVSCKYGLYETGDSELSYLRADFVEASTNGVGAFTSAVTDDGVSLTLSPALYVDWKPKARAVYRAMLYYDKVENGVTKPISLQSVLLLKPKTKDEEKEWHTDPLGLESIWISKNNRYANLSLIIKKGSNISLSSAQKIGVLKEAVTKHEKGKAYHFLLTHYQAGQPEYYSVKGYVSIPIYNYHSGDSLYITVNTYKGKVVKSFLL